MNERKDRIDLNNLSERELLILLARDQERIKDDQERIKDQCDEMDHKLQELSLKVNTLETKAETKGRFWGAVAGFVTAIFVALIEKLFK